LTKQIIIVGYHRSGTSAISQNLMRAGLFLGHDLLGAKPSNPHGHFEDREFLDINEALLRFNGSQWDCTSEPIALVPKFAQAHARRLIARRLASHDIWGFKDPRICLLMDFWQSMLPDAHFLICLRHYTACVDSVIRRRLADLPSVHSNRLKANHAEYAANADAACINWCIYMNTVLRFYNKQSERCSMVRVDELNGDFSLAKAVNTRIGTMLETIQLDETFDPALFRRSKGIGHASAVSDDVHGIARQTWSALLETMQARRIDQ